MRCRFPEPGQSISAEECPKNVEKITCKDDDVLVRREKRNMGSKHLEAISGIACVLGQSIHVKSLV